MNRQAFLDTLAVSEGTKDLGDDGYNVLVGGELFHDYSHHPNVLVTLNKTGLKSTAAGRYQFLKRTWDALQAKLGLPDFGHASQDAGCVELITEAGALADVDAGRFDDAVTKCRRIWASLPGAGYGQHENKLSDLRAAYQRAGGVVSQ
ncbi:glycoside hydrolase family 104 protein [Luteibacter sp. E-22]|uniref:glycoside hydrolase family 24 protein n=1 Tax=Luteibacter sp. E-22 TaxID=3404050 RepID=UPI003CF0A4D7